MTSIACLRTEHLSGINSFPIFIGFMKAKDLFKFAEAPQFSLTTPHEVIAGNISDTPVREWQRPLDPERTDEIARIFSASNEIMPNAVLLAAPNATDISVSARAGNLWVIDVELQGGKRPLWILDGQHRIKGLSQVRPNDEIPFVLLSSHNGSAIYQESTFAKIFAQVTTTAEGLHPLHDGWLTFAFRLGKYDPTSPVGSAKNSQQLEAMEMVVALCHERHLNKAKTQTNPFFNRIAFNPASYKRTTPSPAIGPAMGGFQIDANEMQVLTERSYYSKQMTVPKLSPLELAREVGLSYEALVACHNAAQRADSILLNPAGAAGSKGHKALQEGFLYGVFRYLATHPVPGDWMQVLRPRAFDTTDWRSSSWSTASRSGTQGTINRKIARSIFDNLFSKDLNGLFLPGMSVPPRVDLKNYFAGDIGWGIEVQGRRTGKTGNKMKFAGSMDPSVRLESGMAVSAIDIAKLRLIALGRMTSNIVAVTVADISRPFEKNWSFQSLRAGTRVDDAVHLHSNPITLRLEFTFYGGRSRYVELEVGWA